MDPACIRDHRRQRGCGGNQAREYLSINKRLDRETDADKRQAILDQIAATEAGIQELYEGTEEAEGLYALMRRAAQLTVERAGIDALYQTSMLDQEEMNSGLRWLWETCCAMATGATLLMRRDRKTCCIWKPRKSWIHRQSPL